jgi:DNA-directed RNA polymerase specialized sigma24 family protein
MGGIHAPLASLALEEAGQMLGISHRTAKRHWAYARAWLRVEIAGSATGQPLGNM